MTWFSLDISVVCLAVECRKSIQLKGGPPTLPPYEQHPHLLYSRNTSWTWSLGGEAFEDPRLQKSFPWWPSSLKVDQTSKGGVLTLFRNDINHSMLVTETRKASLVIDKRGTSTLCKSVWFGLYVYQTISLPVKTWPVQSPRPCHDCDNHSDNHSQSTLYR